MLEVRYNTALKSGLCLGLEFAVAGWGKAPALIY